MEVVPEVAPEGEKKEKPEDKAEAEPEDKTEAEPEDKTEGKPKKITEKEPETDLETELEDKLDVTPEEQDDVEEEKAVDELLESISIEYTDFFPTKDSITVIAHLDVDGILCVSAINQMIMSIKEPTTDSETEGDLGNKLRVFFTSPLKIFSTLAKSIPDINKIDEDDFSIGKLFLCDLSLNRDTLLGSSIYDSVKWFDHHEVDPDEQYDSDIENIELVLDPTGESATSIVCDYFKLDNELSSIANEIDTNEIKSDKAKRLREIVGAMKLKYSGSKLKKILYDFAYKMAMDIDVINNEIYNPLIEEYNKWVENLKKYATENIKTHSIKERKIGILEIENTAPIYAINDFLKDHEEAPFDILAVLINQYDRIGKDKNNKFKNKKFTKLELRTHTDIETHELAKMMGGGGHKYASGATILQGLKNDELLKTIETYFTTI